MRTIKINLLFILKNCSVFTTPKNPPNLKYYMNIVFIIETFSLIYSNMDHSISCVFLCRSCDVLPLPLLQQCGSDIGNLIKCHKLPQRRCIPCVIYYYYTLQTVVTIIIVILLTDDMIILCSTRVLFAQDDRINFI